MRTESGLEARQRVTNITREIERFAAIRCLQDYDVVIYVRDRKRTPAITGQGMSEKYRLVYSDHSRPLLDIIQREITAAIVLTMTAHEL